MVSNANSSRTYATPKLLFILLRGSKKEMTHKLVIALNEAMPERLYEALDAERLP
ncbi:hypothetical protein RintRC_5609 [Richelia intracellularis]|nr:hypothetical protein RintRC_5609 [Richelia intracellularis]